MGSKKHKKHKSEKGGTDTDDGGQEKPLKLVLNIKMGGQSSSNADGQQGTASPASQHEERSRHKHKKKKKKKSSDKSRERIREGEHHSHKRPHEDDDSIDEEEEDEEDEGRMRTTDNEESDGNSSPSRKLREPRSCTLKGSDGIILKQMLNYLVKNLQNKDVNGFFAVPVTDTIAPGYSSIILQPMDFSTMTAKIEASEYANVMEFKTPSTQVKVDNQPRPADEPNPVMNRPERDIDRFDAIPDDDLSPEEILSQAQDAAQAAKNALTARKPKTDLGFLRLEDDGTTSMTILNPWNNGVVSSTQKVISLGDYMGKLKSGSGSLFKFKEDKRNKVCPETYLCYGPFSSHAPSYDSSFASCSKEESDLLLHTYGGEIGVQYAKSVQKFVENAGISAVEMVDKLLDTLTNGQHSKSRVMLEEQKKKEEEAAEKALQDEMIAKAQKAAEEAAAKDVKDVKDPVQQSLNQTAAMLSDLYHTQNQRLSQDPPPHLGLIEQPSEREADLANKVTNSLVSMAKQVHPRDVVSTPAVRGALGISSAPPKQLTQQQRASGASGIIAGGQSNMGSKNKERSMSDDSEDDGDGEDDSDDDIDDEEEELQEQSNTSKDVVNVTQRVQEDRDEVDGGEDGEEEGEDSEEEDMEEG
ncbi:bromodomain-containing protein 7-like [Plakobranchus ocellatus]|uniref:Bromodomain-containing protein 7-like n=1 Tax=Plakobranchus ocellatus TaxID=259542 RepID=A0AAV4AV61_9GAST|nr:bromodomain-containing protein 7-like [Plakobranchus ocellatus]